MLQHAKPLKLRVFEKLYIYREQKTKDCYEYFI